MYDSMIDHSQLNRCLICHAAPCTSACPQMDPARILRALRFENESVAAAGLASDCAGCSSPCVESCPIHLEIPSILDALRADIPQLEEAPNWQQADLSCEICGVPLENPFLLSSSVVSSTYDMCARAFEAGWAGVAFKTICLMDIHEASPRFSAVKSENGTFYGFKNIEQLSDHALTENLKIFSDLKKNYPTKVLVVSIMGRDEQEWEDLARAADKAGADVIECNFSCPNMKDGGLGSDVGQDINATAKFTRAARRGSKKPLLVKLTPNVADMRPFARVCVQEGADGIAAINTIKSITGVNLDTLTAAPAVHGSSAVGGYSGPAVKPIALRFIAEMAADPMMHGVHLSGMGGVRTWKDALEFILLGAGSIQITTSVMEYGYRIIDDLTSGLQVYMAQRGIQKLSHLLGAAVENIVSTNDLERDTIIFPKFLKDRCVGCGRCYISCQDGGHQAIKFDSQARRPILDGTKCVGCHLCVLVCPENAIRSSGKRFLPKSKR